MNPEDQKSAEAPAVAKPILVVAPEDQQSLKERLGKLVDLILGEAVTEEEGTLLRLTERHIQATLKVVAQAAKLPANDRTFTLFLIALLVTAQSLPLLQEPATEPAEENAVEELKRLLVERGVDIGDVAEVTVIEAPGPKEEV